MTAMTPVAPLSTRACSAECASLIAEAEARGWPLTEPGLEACVTCGVAICLHRAIEHESQCEACLVASWWSRRRMRV